MLTRYKCHSFRYPYIDAKVFSGIDDQGEPSENSEDGECTSLGPSAQPSEVSEDRDCVERPHTQTEWDIGKHEGKCYTLTIGRY